MNYIAYHKDQQVNPFNGNCFYTGKDLFSVGDDGTFGSLYVVCKISDKPAVYGISGKYRIVDVDIERPNTYGKDRCLKLEKISHKTRPLVLRDFNPRSLPGWGAHFQVSHLHEETVRSFNERLGVDESGAMMETVFS